MLAVVCLAYGKTTWDNLDNYTFDKYCKEFGKRYSGEEYELRKQVFEERLESIRAHNKDETKSWKRGVNHLSDKTEEVRHPILMNILNLFKEFGKLLGYNKVVGYAQKASRNAIMNPQPVTLNAPASIDWREKGVVSAVKDQGKKLDLIFKNFKYHQLNLNEKNVFESVTHDFNKTRVNEAAVPLLEPRHFLASRLYPIFLSRYN